MAMIFLTICANAFVPALQRVPTRLQSTAVSIDGLPMNYSDPDMRLPPPRAMDMSDKDVLADLERIEKLSVSELKSEFDDMFLPYDESMGDRVLKLMLLEANFHKREAAKRFIPQENASRFEVMTYQHPELEAIWKGFIKEGDLNRANAFMEFVEDKENAGDRYATYPMYQEVFKMAEDIMNKPVFTSSKVEFAGMPLGMNDAGIKSMFSPFGSVKDVTITSTTDSVSGTAEFETVEAAMAAIKQYNGQELGLGVTVSLKMI